MLSIPPKLQRAFDQGNFQPVTYLELQTKVLDQLSAAAPVMASIPPGALNIPSDKRNVELSYPDDNGAVGTQISNIPTGRLSAHSNLGISASTFTYALWQSFTVGEDSQQATKLKKIKTELRLNNFSSDPHNLLSAGLFQIKCKIYDTTLGIPDLSPSNRFISFIDRSISFIDGIKVQYFFDLVDPGALSVSSTIIDPFNIPSVKTVFNWDFNVDLHSGRQYLALLELERVSGSNLNFKMFSVEWSSSSGQDSGEFSGNGRNDQLKQYLVAEFATYETTPKPVLQIQYDLNGTPLDAGSWEMIDTQVTFKNPVSGGIESTSISYHGWAGSTLGAKTIDLGIVKSGDAIPGTALRQFYTLEATLSATPNGLRTPSFQSARPKFPGVLGGFASHAITLDGKDIPPAIKATPSIPTKMDIRSNITQRGGIKVELGDIGGEVARVAIQEHLKNLPVQVRFGHLPTATSKEDLAILYTGIIKDFSYKEKRLTLSIEGQGINLNKKIPIIRSGSFKTFQDDAIRRTFDGMTLVQAIKRLIENEAGVDARFVDDQSFLDVDAYLKGADTQNLFITNRVILKQVEAQKEIRDLLKLISASLVEREDGKLSLIQFPVTASPIDIWDETVVAANEIQPESISKSLTNLCLVHYNSVDGKPQDKVAFGDLNSMQDWAPGSDDFIADYSIKTGWLGDEATYHGKTVAARIGERIVKILKNGLIEIKFKTSISKYAAEVGDKINLATPTFLKKGKLGTVKSPTTSFVLIEKKPNIDKGTIQWTAVEDIQIQRPPTAAFTAAPLSGVPDLLVTIDVTPSNDPDGTIILYEADFDYNGSSFVVMASRTTPGTLQHTYTSSAIGFKTIALRVTDNNGAVHLTTKTTNNEEAVIRVLGAPTVRISSQVSAPDQPLQVFLSSASIGVTAVITKKEWDLSYDGTTFNPEVEGDGAIVNLPYQSITVALRVTDDDGLTAMSTATFTGKTLAPAPVQNFFVSQNGDKIVFNWDVVGDPDRDAYEIRKGAAWASSTLISKEILTTSFMTIAPLKPGVHTYLIKAINTTGRFSITETIITITIIDPRNRNVIATADRKAQGWPGTKTGLVYEVANDRWWLDSSDDFTDNDTTITDSDTRITLLSGTINASGTYEGTPVDLGAVINGNRLSIDSESSVIPDPVGTSMKSEYSESDDGLSYSPFAQINSGDLGFRFVKERVTLSNNDGASNLSLIGCVLNIDVPDVFDSQSGIVVASSGTTHVLFKRHFNGIPLIPVPTVNPIIENATHGQYAKITNLTTEGHDVSIHSMQTDTQEVGIYGYHAKGF